MARNRYTAEKIIRRESPRPGNTGGLRIHEQTVIV